MKYLKPVLKKIIKEPEQVKKASKMRDDKEMLEFLLQLGINKKTIVSEMESYYALMYIELQDLEIDLSMFEIFDMRNLRRDGILPFKFKDNTYYFVMTDIVSQSMRENIQQYCRQRGLDARFMFAFEHEIEAKFDEIEERLKSYVKEEASQNVKDISSDYEANPDDTSAVSLVNKFITKGIKARASDIHIEPLETGLQARYRVDGMLSLKEVYDYNPEFIANIMARLKIISGMDIAERRRPQDGRIGDFVVDGEKYDLRASTVPTKFGEKAVLRIFSKDTGILGFEKLGLYPEEIKKVKNVLNNAYGIIYLAGATGSGKTTTLYTMIQEINKDTVNIYTIEDPIEKTIPNVNQIQLDLVAGVDYASTLRALLRQDPDVIVVGEIRDQETADLAVRSSLTGHLVLTTIHANTALETIPRLRHMGIEAYMISASTLAFMSQRLARVLCPHCREQAPLKEYEKYWLDLIVKKFDIALPDDMFYRAVGCEKCHNIGYKGRTALFEVIPATDDFRELVAKDADIPTLYKQARKDGFVSLEMNGINKALEGITSIEEVMRVL
jgi:type IV pilus assembly protein PilB